VAGSHSGDQTHYRRPFREPGTFATIFVRFDFARNPVLDAAGRVIIAPNCFISFIMREI
jgi:hypothetical protein